MQLNKYGVLHYSEKRIGENAFSFFFNCFRKKNQALFLPMANQQRAYITSIHQSHLPLSVNKSDWQIRLAELYRI